MKDLMEKLIESGFQVPALSTGQRQIAIKFRATDLTADTIQLLSGD
jgi:hypothetical protein